jgi:hypothetical protein
MKHKSSINQQARARVSWQADRPDKAVGAAGTLYRCMEYPGAFSAALLRLTLCSFAPGAVESARCAAAAAPLLEYPRLRSQPQWTDRWFGPDASIRSLLGGVRRRTAARFAGTRFPVPVLAYPAGPASGIGPGIVRARRSRFPFDAGDDRVELAWEGRGPAANFFPGSLLIAGGPFRPAARAFRLAAVADPFLNPMR